MEIQEWITKCTGITLGLLPLLGIFQLRTCLRHFLFKALDTVLLASALINIARNKPGSVLTPDHNKKRAFNFA